MKVFKLFLVLSVIIAIGYFSWDYYAGKLLKENCERATLVFGEPGRGYYVQE
ncbi:MAG TPA: hypothetical protein PLG67_10585 [Bacillota bacterium]|jgi:hypothetical protein|nr:hypothetical protein [Bacillota bacterium]HQL37027.1 hypothetical protein [Bacillota bacterium]